jgi:hypothetical protein
MTREQLWRLELAVRGRKADMTLMEAKHVTLSEMIDEADERLSELVTKARHGVTNGDLLVATAELTLLLAAARER